MILFTLDRFEQNIAVLENRDTKEMIDVPVEKIPIGAKEGDILTFSNNAYVINLVETKKAKERIKKLMDDLRKK